MSLNDHPVVKEIRRLAAENPDHVDPDAVVGRVCRYTGPEGEPSCIVGHLLRNLYPDKPIDMVETKSAAAAFEYLGIEIPHRVAGWIVRVQCRQDEADSWSKAVAYADQRYPL